MTNFNKENLFHSVQQDHLLLKGMFFPIVPGRIESRHVFALSKDTLILACLQNSLMIFFSELLDMCLYSHCVCI